MAIQKISGKAVQLTIGTGRVYHTKATVKPKKEMADSTDASNYDVGTDLIWKEQMPISCQVELEIEGKYDMTAATGSAAWVGTMYTAKDTAGNPLPVVLKYNATTTAVSGNFDLTDFQAEKPIDDLISFTATLTSHGVVAYNPTGGS